MSAYNETMDTACPGGNINRLLTTYGAVYVAS